MPRPVFNVPETADAWFWPKVDKSGECWIWKAGKSAGYGMASMNRRLRHAHAIAWELTNGPIPDGLDVLHNCPGGDNKACVNPAHLWLGTQRDNTIDWYRKTRPQGRQITFVNGPGWTKKNGTAESPTPYGIAT